MENKSDMESHENSLWEMYLNRRTNPGPAPVHIYRFESYTINNYVYMSGIENHLICLFLSNNIETLVVMVIYIKTFGKDQH